MQLIPFLRCTRFVKRFFQRRLPVMDSEHSVKYWRKNKFPSQAFALRGMNQFVGDNFAFAPEIVAYKKRCHNAGDPCRRTKQLSLLLKLPIKSLFGIGTCATRQARFHRDAMR